MSQELVTVTEVASEVATVELLRGARCPEGAPPALLVEVPHGADRRAHYEAVRARLVGELPEDLHEFFHMNTDEGAYDVGRWVAEELVRRDPSRSAKVIRCLIPRTFIDANRLEDSEEGKLGEGGMTAGLHAYIKDPRDRALLLSMHRAYVDLVEAAYEEVCGGEAPAGGGFALIPHTYGPVSVGGFDAIDEHIVENLRRAHEPERLAGWPVRPEIDLITRTGEGERIADDAMVEALLDAYRRMDLQAIEGKTYYLHPATLGYRWTMRYPGRTLCLELRRDLIAEWVWDQESRILSEAVARHAAPLAEAIDAWLRARDR